MDGRRNFREFFFRTFRMKYGIYTAFHPGWISLSKFELVHCWLLGERLLEMKGFRWSHAMDLTQLFDIETNNQRSPHNTAKLWIYKPTILEQRVERCWTWTPRQRDPQIWTGNALTLMLLEIFEWMIMHDTDRSTETEPTFTSLGEIIVHTWTMPRPKFCFSTHARCHCKHINYYQRPFLCLKTAIDSSIHPKYPHPHFVSSISRIYSWSAWPCWNFLPRFRHGGVATLWICPLWAPEHDNQWGNHWLPGKTGRISFEEG